MRSLVLLVLCVVVIDAAVFHSVIRHGGKVKRTIQRGEARRNHRPLRLQSQGNATGLQPVNDFWDNVYLVNVTFGTPPQEFSLILDSMQPVTWLIDTSCRQAICTGGPTSGHTKRQFDKTKSTTYKMDEEKVRLPLSDVYDFEDATGDIGNDVFTMADFTLTAKSLYIVSSFDSNSSNNFGYLPADGSLGLGQLFVFAGHYELDSVLASLKPLLRQPMFTLWYDRKERSIGSIGGMVTYGSEDNIHCGPAIRWAPAEVGVMWKTNFGSYSFGNVSRSFAIASIVIDSQSSYINLDGEDVDKLAVLVGAWKDENYWQSYLVKCSVRDFAPPIVYSVNGFNLVIPATEYIIDENFGGGNCELKVLPMSGREFYLGDPLLRSYCVTIDFGSQQIGFSPVKH